MHPIRLFSLILFLGFGLTIAQDMNIIESGMSPGEGGNPNEPNNFATANALQWVSNSPTLDLRHGPMDASVIPVNHPFIVGYALEPFERDMFGMAVSGNTHILKGALGLKRLDSITLIGGRSHFQYLTVQMPAGDSWYLNGGLGAFAERDLLRKSNQLAIAGVSLDVLVYDPDFAGDMVLESYLGAQLTGYGRWTKWINRHRVTLGGMLQQSVGGRLMQNVLGVTGQYSAYVIPSVELNANAQYRLLVFQHLIGSNFQPDPDRSQMNISIGGTWWYSSLIGFEAGYKATLLITGYKAHHILLGSRFSF